MIKMVKFFVFFVFVIDLTFSARSIQDYKHVKEDTQLSNFFTKLWTEDGAKSRVGVDIILDKGNQTSSSETADKSPRKLFQYVDESFLSRPTTAAMIALHDNYIARTSWVEDQESNPTELHEIDIFLDRVVNTPTMQRAFQFLRDNNLLPVCSPASYPWKRLLRHLWFDLYSRHKGRLGSSGFEHVFMAEIDDGKIKGMHNWIWVYLMEKRGVIDYRGYISPATSLPVVLSNQWAWPYDGHLYRKKRTSLLVGSTPEFDLALFTVLHLKRPMEVTRFKIGPQEFLVQDYNNANGTVASIFFLL